ncbi:MAG: T9SS type A sorting domain-containing protein [Bacteroidia bacterium]|nr:T9SS type A sorting domain-containing protein [Bacteroidia bacterium]
MKIKFTLLALLFALSHYANSQQLMTENFDYPSGSPLTSNSWTIIPTSVVLPISATNTGLSFTGYTLSGIGNAARVDTTGQDLYRDLYNSTTTGSLYTSFMLNVAKATTTGDYFFAYLPQTSTTGYTERLFIRAAGTGFYRIGVSKGTETVVYSTDSFALNNTSLVVVKYQFTTGNTNDTVSVFNFTATIPSSEPTPTVFTVGGATADATTLGRLALRQGTAASAPRLTIDGIRTANTWGELNAATSTNQPSQFSVAFSTTTTTSTRITWTKNGNYIDSLMTTLVFVKPLTAINIGTPNLSPSAYTANANFTLANSFYQNDGAAKCTFLGDSNTFSLSGLNQNTLYQVSILTVRNLDSAYSIPTNSSVTTLSTAPRTVTGINITAIGQTEATINWIRPTGYNTANNTIVIYLKANTAVTSGTPNTNPLLINADSSFLGSGSALMLDSNARCVYKGDTTKVTVTGLNPSTNYFIAAYAINDIDSNYSPVLSGTFRTNSLGPVNVKSATLVSLSSNNCRISWTKDTSYNNANFTTLVFLKQGSNVIQGSPNKDIATILANDTFRLGSVYQNDTAAFCVYKGDSNFVTPTDLNPATTYFALIYVVSDADTLYSNPTIIGGTTRGLPPENVSAITVAGITTTSTKISWNKPSSYTNATLTTLVFVKAFNSINGGTPTRTVNFYNANANFASTFSTRYQNDTAAKCVYRGDTNFVNITAINNFTNYHVLIYVIRDADSTYSINSAIGTGTAAPNPPAPTYYTISQINGINLTTGAPDSLNIRVSLRGVVYSPNQRTTGQGGIQFLMRDNTGGITINNTASTLGYTPTEGDSISVFGIVSSTRGLLTLITLDSLAVLGNGKTLANPKIVTKLDESTENDLVRINTVKFITRQVGNWAANGNYLVVNLNNDTFTIRTYNNTGLLGIPFPTTTYFHVKGLGSQVSNNNAPYAFIGYQILPRYAADIIPFNPLSTFGFVNPANNANITIQGDTAQTLNYIWTKSINDVLVPTATYTLLVDTLNGTFRNPIATYQSGNGGLDTSKVFTYSQMRNLITSLGVTTNQSISLKFKVTATSGVFNLNSDSITVNFTLGSMVSVENKLNAELLVYPNPVNDKLIVQLPENIGKTAQIELMDLTGKVLVSKTINNINNTITIDCSSLNTGMYLIKLQSENLVLSKKILKN